MTISEAHIRIEELTQKINYYNHLYYQEDVSEISDLEFDQLLQELIELETRFPSLLLETSPSQRVGGTITKYFETAEHQVRMLSLGNTYSEEDLIAFDERVRKGLETLNYSYFCELKFDGVAISLVYENGKLARAVTRGDGTHGDVVTENIKTIRNIPLVITDPLLPQNFEVRGEVFLPKKEFDKINQERERNNEPLLANPRNAASGTVKMQDSGIVSKRRLNCYFYQLLGTDIEVETHEEAILLIEKLGFNVSPTYQKCQNMNEVINFIELWRAKRFDLPLDTDGVVLKINDYQQREELGFTAKFPRWAIAYKYQAESAESELLSITYQVGRTGAITPVANLSPVHLAGTIVKRASLHNANEIERLGLFVGDHVFVEKGGEIIPKITGVSLVKRKANGQAVQFITHCPECGSELIREDGEAKHFCPNDKSCPPQILGRIEHFVHKRAMNIDSLGTERIRALIDNGYISNPLDIYYLNDKREELIGLEMGQDQYEKAEDGMLYISLHKALFALTEDIPLRNIVEFLENKSSKNLKETFREFQHYLRIYNKKININTGTLQLLEYKLIDYPFPKIEDFLPVPHVLSLILGKNLSFEELKRLSIQEKSVHGIILKSDIHLTDDQQKKIKKLKSNTFQEGVVGNMMEGIEKSKDQPFEKVLFALGIRNIGENTAQILTHSLKSIDQLINASREELLAINGIGETLVQSLEDFFTKPENLNIIEGLRTQGLKFESEEKERVLNSNTLQGLKILASGKLNHFKRDEIVEYITSNGGEYVKTVNKSLSFIIEGEEMGPSKKEKAKQLGIKLISEEEFLALLNKDAP
jgi:DNA ligase (NAD+)